MSWVKSYVLFVWKFAFPPFSPHLLSGVPISKQNTHRTFDPINSFTPVIQCENYILLFAWLRKLPTSLSKNCSFQFFTSYFRVYITVNAYGSSDSRLGGSSNRMTHFTGEYHKTILLLSLHQLNVLAGERIYENTVAFDCYQTSTVDNHASTLTYTGCQVDETNGK